ncbi:hypothetical protein [Mycobacterium gordonae]|jgi:hypothetical protein|uniref:DUF4334 domain-containing protein n=1 Tax=Mycobacterium gordonae TaxID=1778 RepID=A0A1A6BMR8_MYCGO|nr:hypothetical protein [Mycobacterium gordonae]MCV7010344.1 hypothetical protein [Mycobacterium gordonae]OBS03499.1 hypothetical protein A9W98_09105 [Mycobacterium gordonae]ODR21077.1 hypothetical protein BHQ23_13780 [Mycobacterium gordonae]ORV69878.1 hypothetical protein AWC08_06110 [Mycobacterium gordonae]
MTKAATNSKTRELTTSVLSDLRQLAVTAPALARRQGWDYLRELGKSGKRDQLAALFARGEAPDGPRGALEGLIVGNLFGIPEAHLANPLLKIDPTWRGKTFDADTGFNRLAPVAKFAMPVIAPLYRGLRRAGSEMVGFGFNHRIETAAISPFNTVRALDYSPAEYRNPSVRTFPIKRTRDEIVELLPGLYLGRALLTMRSGEVRLVAYFALREFADEGATR